MRVQERRERQHGASISGPTPGRLPLFVFLGALVGFVALTAHGGLWKTLGVEHMRPFFADTVTTLAASETWAEGGDPYRDNYRDPYRRPHSYGPWWLWAASLGLERRDAWWLGSLQVLAFLAAAAAVTERVRVMTNVWVLPQHPPAMVAQQVGTLDQLSNGRLTVAVGIGGREEDYRALGGHMEYVKPLAEVLARGAWHNDGAPQGRRIEAASPLNGWALGAPPMLG